MRRKTGAACKGKHADRTSLPHNSVFREGQPVQVCWILTQLGAGWTHLRHPFVLNVAEQNKMSAAACKLTSVVRPETQYFIHFTHLTLHILLLLLLLLLVSTATPDVLPCLRKKPQECTSTSARQRQYCCQKFYRHTWTNWRKSQFRGEKQPAARHSYRGLTRQV